MGERLDDARAPDAHRIAPDQKLNESEQRFRAFVMATSDVVYCMSADWREMRYLVGKDFIDDTSHPDRDWLERYIHPLDREHVLRAIAEAISRKSIFELEHRVIRADGTLGWAFSRAVPLLDANGAITEWFGAAKDVTERKQAEEELRETDRRKDEFIAVLAHELRNPLAPLMNAAELLRRAQIEDPLQLQARMIIDRQIAQLSRLIEDLMDTARIRTGRLQLQLEQVSLATLVDRAVESVSGLIRQRGQHLSVKLDSQLFEITADPARLQQVLVNLLNNAAKYTDEGGRIDLLVTRDADHAVMRVRDTGIGIEPALMSKLFQPFMQAQHSSNRARGGLGIGLSLVRRLVEMHGGTVEVRSSVGRGSEFTVKLPLLTAAARVEVASKQPYTQSAANRSLRVLVVDDDVDAAQSLVMLLQTSGHTAHMTHDGVSAMELVGRLKPDIAFVDIALPRLDGHEFAREVRGRGELEHVELVAMSGYGASDDVIRSRQAGYSEHLIKPFGFEAVEAILARVAEARRAERDH